MELRNQRRITRVRHELRMRELEVARTERIGASYARITFTGDALDGFTSDAFDDHVKLLLPAAPGKIARRDYTPRSFDHARRELVIEFLLHAQGVASDWARSARAGDRVTIGGPKGSMIIPADYDWHLLAGDATALPAIHRRVQELPPGARIFAVVQVPDAADRRPFDASASVQATWVQDGEALLAAVAALELPVGEGFAWGAGEAGTMLRLRTLLAGRRGLSRESMKIAAYWKQGVSEFHERIE